MAIKTIEYDVNIASITPATEQFAGTQGDHRVTDVTFTISSELSDAIASVASDSTVMYRFDIYDGEGGIWSSESAKLNDSHVSIELEERHTRFGGRITVYLVITALSKENDTEVELYSFPAVLRLKNKPEGTAKDGENYESVTGLVEVAKAKVDEAASYASAAENSNQEAQEFAARVEEKLKNGDFDGVGVKSTEIIDDELIITYTDNTSQNLGNVKGDTGPQGQKGEQGEKGEKGDKGDKGDPGSIENVDQSYNPESENAQSGKAVAEAIDNKVDKLTPTDRLAINEMVEGSKGLYCADWGGTKLVKLDYDKTPYTVPYRMENGHIIVGMIAVNRTTGQEENFRGCALPHTYLNQELEYLKGLISSAETNATNKANTAQKTADNKKISTGYTYAKTTLDWNSVYVIWSSSGNADINLYNSATGAKVTDTAGEELPATQVCVLLLPKENSVNITSSGEEQPQKTKRCVLFGTTGNVFSSVVSRQFLIGDGDLYFTPTSSGASIYKIGL